MGGAGGASGVIRSERGGQGVTCERKRRAGGRLVAGAASGGGERKAGDKRRRRVAFSSCGVEGDGDQQTCGSRHTVVIYIFIHIVCDSVGEIV